MIKKLLFSASAICLLATSVSAQTNNLASFEEKEVLKTAKQIEKREKPQNKVEVNGDVSYYYDQNNARITSELNTFLNGNPITFDTLALYTYEVKQKNQGGTDYWQSCLQTIPNTDALTLNAIDFIGGSLTSSSNVVVSVLDKQLNVLTSETINITTYGFQKATFASPVSHNDTMYVAFTMETLVDSFEIAQSHSIWNGYDFSEAEDGSKIFNTALPFNFGAAILAYDADYTTILALLSNGFDFFVYPSFTYDVPANFTATTTALETATFTTCKDQVITFENTANTAHIMNPILNSFEWDRLANGGTFPYTDYDFADASTANSVQAHTKDYAYTAVATDLEVKAYAIIAPWTQTVRIDSSVFNITIEDCTVSIDEVANTNIVSIYPNPAKNILNVTVANTNATLTVFDLTGKTVFTKQLVNKTNAINVANLTNGFYVYNVKTLNGKFTTGNFVVNK